MGDNARATRGMKRFMIGEGVKVMRNIRLHNGFKVDVLFMNGHGSKSSCKGLTAFSGCSTTARKMKD